MPAQTDEQKHRHDRVLRLEAITKAQDQLGTLIEIAAHANNREELTARLAAALDISEIAAYSVISTSFERLTTNYERAFLEEELTDLRNEA